MALIICPDCGRKVSSEAPACPDCGRPIKKRSKRRRRSRLPIILGLISMIVIIVGIISVLLIFKPWNKLKKENWIEEADKSVLFVTCYDGQGEIYATGSGFLLFDDKTVVTNYHVIDGVTDVKVFTNNNVEYEVANVRNYSEEQDLAILELDESTGLNPLTIGDSTIVNKGDDVTAIGSPKGYQNTVSTGVLSSRVDNNGYTDLQITAPISHGSSGGALFNSSGEVIGVTYSGLDSSVAQNINFAIPIEDVVNLYNLPVEKVQTVVDITKDNIPYFDEQEKVRGEIGDWITISYEEMALNPINYIAIPIEFSGVISSKNIQDGFTGYEMPSLFVIDTADNVTDDWEKDWVIGVGDDACPYIQVDYKFDKHWDDFKVGDDITLIGVLYGEAFKYHFCPAMIYNTDVCYLGSDSDVRAFEEEDKSKLQVGVSSDSEFVVAEGDTCFHNEFLECSYSNLYIPPDVDRNYWANTAPYVEPYLYSYQDVQRAGIPPCPYCFYEN